VKKLTLVALLMFCFAGLAAACGPPGGCNTFGPAAQWNYYTKKCSISCYTQSQNPPQGGAVAYCTSGPDNGLLAGAGIQPAFSGNQVSPWWSVYGGANSQLNNNYLYASGTCGDTGTGHGTSKTWYYYEQCDTSPLTLYQSYDTGSWYCDY
jgi:hypothetical protein